MKSAKILLTIGGAVLLPYFGWLLISPYIAPGAYAESMPVSAFVVGTWQTETQATDTQGSYRLVDRLEFASSHTLIHNQVRIYSDNSRSIDFYNIKSQYSFLADTHVKIIGRSIEDWTITRDGENLRIETGGSVVPSGQYTRLATVQWPIFALGLGILLIGILLMMPLPLNQIHGDSIRTYLSNLRSDARSFTSIGLRVLSIVCVFAVGLLIGMNIWGKWSWLLISLPWDAIMLLEISLILLFFGIGMSLRAKIKNLASRPFASGWMSYLGVFMVGFSAKGILVGLGYLLLYLLLGGSYGAGA